MLMQHHTRFLLVVQSIVHIRSPSDVQYQYHSWLELHSIALAMMCFSAHNNHIKQACIEHSVGVSAQQRKDARRFEITKLLVRYFIS